MEWVGHNEDKDINIVMLSPTLVMAMLVLT